MFGHFEVSWSYKTNLVGHLDQLVQALTNPSSFCETHFVGFLEEDEPVQTLEHALLRSTKSLWLDPKKNNQATFFFVTQKTFHSLFS